MAKKIPNDVKTGRAISIRQPYVEAILRKKKRFEYRSRPTKIRGRVYLYASLKAGSEDGFRKLGLAVGELPVGYIVGSVEIVGCEYDEENDCYAYKLKNPKRYSEHIKPKGKPQPCWFYPFGKK